MANIGYRPHSRNGAQMTVEEQTFRREQEASEAARTAADKARGPRSVVMRRRSSDWSGEPRDPSEDAIWKAQREVITAASETLSEHEPDHEVVALCAGLADRLELGERERSCVLAAARVHDIGRVTVPAEVLDKPGPLSSADWSLMCQHTVIGERILRSVPEMIGVARIVRSSHERWDGRGYPDGLRGVQIPMASRILLCAEAFHAIQCERPWRPARSEPEALEEMAARAGSQFDPRVVTALHAVAEERRGPLRRRFGRR
jgi:HD-GYP domain-containing protein (c-di-GMP phosphodiesterase class II)